MLSLAKIFYSPREVFQRVDEKPHWILPLVTVTLLTLIITAVLLPTVIQPSAVERLHSRFEGSDEQLEQALKFMRGPRFYTVTMGSVLITAPLKMLAQAGIFALFLLFLRGEVNFRKILGVTAYSALISVVGGIVKGGIMLGTKSPEAYTNLNLLFPFVEKNTFLFRLFSGADFFNIWSLLLFGLGLSIVGKIERKKSYILVFSLWLVLIVLFSFLGGITGRFGGAT